jgi:hypothetical protein
MTNNNNYAIAALTATNILPSVSEKKYKVSN